MFECAVVVDDNTVIAVTIAIFIVGFNLIQVMMHFYLMHFIEMEKSPQSQRGGLADQENETKVC